MLIKKMWALLTLWTGALLVMSGCGMRSTVSHPDLVLDLVQMRLFGMVLGQPVPSECHRMIGEELIIHGANLSIVGECTLWNYKAARSGFLKGMVGRHPAEQLYDELRIREPRPNVRPDFGQTFR